MVFDLTSFLFGIAAGALTAGLAGLLHSLEKTAGVQERLRVATQKIEELASTLAGPGMAGSNDASAKAKIDDLQRMLDEIQQEIRRMYKRTSR